MLPSAYWKAKRKTGSIKKLDALQVSVRGAELPAVALFSTNVNLITALFGTLRDTMSEINPQIHRPYALNSMTVLSLTRPCIQAGEKIIKVANIFDYAVITAM